MKSRQRKSVKADSITHNPIDWWVKLNPVYKFLLLFLIVMFLFYQVYIATWFQNGFHNSLLAIYSKLSAIVLSTIGYSVTAVGEQLNGTVNLNIKRGCDALEPFAIYLTGILAFPASLNHKLKGLLLGAVVLFLLNIIRIVTLYIALIYSSDVFNFLHVTLWQILFLVITVILFMKWMKPPIKQKEK